MRAEVGCRYHCDPAWRTACDECEARKATGARKSQLVPVPVVDLPLGLNGLAADAGAEGGAQLPAGARHIRNDYGAYAWGGMCPRRVTSHTATCSRCTP